MRPEMMRRQALRKAFCQWLFGLPPWDGEIRIDHLLRDLFNAGAGGSVKLQTFSGVATFQDSATTRAAAASRALILGPLARALEEPMPPMDNFVVLVGDPGIGKSEFLQQLLPEEFNQTDAVSALRDFDPLRADFQWHHVGAPLARCLYHEVSCDVAYLGSRLTRICEYLQSADTETVRCPYDAEPLPVLGTPVFTMQTRNVNARWHQWEQESYRIVPLLERRRHIRAVCHRLRDQWWAEGLAYFRTGHRSPFYRKTNRGEYRA